MSRSLRLAFGLLIIGFYGLSIAVGQIDEIRIIDGKKVECLHSGLMSNLNDCGFRSDWYAYVFVGSISAVVPSDQSEMKIQITPEEVFHGDPPTPLNVLTSQGLCLPKVAVGGRWLFYLRKETGKPIVLDYYGNDSRPVANAQEQIETLRRLKTVADFGVVRGRVVSGPGFSDRKAVAGAHVLASRKTDNTQYSTTTNEDGDFEFEPLAPGKYDLTVDRIGSFQADDDGVEVTRGSCWHLTISRSPHAHLGGHLRHSDGSPVANAPVFIFDGDGYNTTSSDDDGYFQSNGMRPGKYLVGINLPDAPKWKYGGCGGRGCEAPPIYLYYPGMHTRSHALVISLAEDEKRDDINFTLPIQ